MPQSKLIVALDLPERKAILALAKRVLPHCAMLKVGLEAFVAHGPDLVSELRSLGAEVFLDLKLHDIPRTAAAAARETARLDVRLLTVHASGGAEMIKTVREETPAATQVLAVTLLTSLDAAMTRELGFIEDINRIAYRLGALALNGGADGLVCSSLELPVLRELAGSRLVPGIRPAGAKSGDQVRVATPEAAIKNGATWIVVGRPIIEAADPAQAAAAIAAQTGT